MASATGGVVLRSSWRASMSPRNNGDIGLCGEQQVGLGKMKVAKV